MRKLVRGGSETAHLVPYEGEEMAEKRVLTDKERQGIYTMHCMGESKDAIADRYGIAVSTVYRIVREERGKREEGMPVGQQIVAGDKAHGRLMSLSDRNRFEGTCIVGGKSKKRTFTAKNARDAQQQWEKLRTFDDEVKALEDYGHDCCARIDDRIHECCERIREAHQNELSQMLKIYEVAVEFMKEDADAMDTRSGDTASADSPDHGSAGCDCGSRCGVLDEGVAPITTELRDRMWHIPMFGGEDKVELDEEEFLRLCDAIDAIHANLERDYKVACDVNEHQDLEYVALAKRYDNTISLPFDKDGKVWDVGDKLLDDGLVCEVVGIGPNRLYYYVDATDTVEWTQADSRRHYHAPTVEDVLRDVVTLCHNTWKDGSAFEFYDVDDVMESGNIAEYAAKLRLAGDAE